MKKFLKEYITMDGKIIKFDVTGTEEYKFHQNKSPILISDIDINEIVVSNNLPFCKQEYFIGYKHDKKLNLYGYTFQKLIHIEVLIKRNVCIF